MTREAQQIAIAEACGKDVKICPIHHSRTCCGRIRTIPDYLSDLNAMHEAENWYFSQSQTIDEKSLWLDNLAVVCGWAKAETPVEAKFESDLNCSRATAAQRAEAFLRTIGKWEGK